jgi:hypothetical protein
MLGFMKVASEMQKAAGSHGVLSPHLFFVEQEQFQGGGVIVMLAG